MRGRSGAPTGAPGTATSDRGSGLVVEGVVAGYPPINVLHGIDLAIPGGELVAVIGPNGAGKTTLLRSIFGLAAVTAGRIRFDSADITDLPAHRRAALGLCYVTEGRAIFRGLSVSENLDMFAGGRAAPAQMERAFAMFPVLAERRRQTAGTLSGGQQQMLALARAVLHDHRLIMVDELSMGLAPVVIDELFDVLKTLKLSGVTILLVEQYMHRALAFADTAYVMANGRVVFAGEPVELSEESDVISLYLGAS